MLGVWRLKFRLLEPLFNAFYSARLYCIAVVVSQG